MCVEYAGGVIGWVVVSESCCFQSIGVKYCHEVRPGCDRVSAQQIALVNIVTVQSFCLLNCDNNKLKCVTTEYDVETGSS